jgi:fibronectin type 3 domain-containing protein
MDKGIIVGETYYYLVTLIKPNGDEMIYADQTRVMIATPPGEISGLKAAATNGEVELTWKEASAGSNRLAGYLVYRRAKDKDSAAEECLNPDSPIPTLGMFYRDKTALPDITYVYSIRAVDVSDPGQQGKPVSVEIMVFRPTPPPAGLTFQPSDGRVTLSWQEPAGGSFKATGYQVFRASGLDPFPEKPLNETALAATEFSDTGLTNGTVYRYTVKALLDSQQQPMTAASEEIKAVPAVPPVPPTNLKTQYADNAVLLTWESSAKTTQDIAGYNIYRGLSAGAEDKEPLNAQPLANTTYNDTTIAIGNTYFYAIRAVDTSATPLVSELSREVSVALARPSAPKSLTGSGAGGKVTLNWKAVEKSALPVAGYNVYKGLAPGDEAATPITATPVAWPSYADTDVEVGKVYYYLVKVVTSSNPPVEGDPSNEISVRVTKVEAAETTKPETKPAPPAGSKPEASDQPSSRRRRRSAE